MNSSNFAVAATTKASESTKALWVCDRMETRANYFCKKRDVCCYVATENQVYNDTLYKYLWMFIYLLVYIYRIYSLKRVLLPSVLSSVHVKFPCLFIVPGKCSIHILLHSIPRRDIFAVALLDCDCGRLMQYPSPTKNLIESKFRLEVAIARRECKGVSIIPIISNTLHMFGWSLYSLIFSNWLVQ